MYRFVSVQKIFCVWNDILSRWHRLQYILECVTKSDKMLPPSINSELLTVTVNNNTCTWRDWVRVETRSVKVYHVDSLCQCIHRQHKSTMLSLHCFSYVNHHYHPPLFQLYEPLLSPSIVSAMWTIIITLHCFSYVNHLYYFSYVHQIPFKLLTSTSIYAIKL